MGKTGNEKGGTPVNQSVEKVLAILEYMAGRSPERLLDLARELHMNTSTLNRFLLTLKQHGYVAQEEGTDRYYMTYKICTLGNRINRDKDMRMISKPYLYKIAETFGESCCLAVEENHKVVYIDIVQTPGNLLRSMQRIGSIAPMYCTGIGKLLLLNYTEEDLDRYIKSEGLKPFTQYTITTKERLMEELEQVRISGVAYDNEECEIGARCLAAPVYDAEGRVLAGISVTGPSTRLTDEFIQMHIAFFKETLFKISERMGYRGPGAAELSGTGSGQ